MNEDTIARTIPMENDKKEIDKQPDKLKECILCGKETIIDTTERGFTSKCTSCNALFKGKGPGGWDYVIPFLEDPSIGPDKAEKSVIQPEPAFLKRINVLIMKKIESLMDARRSIQKVEETLRELWYEIGTRASAWRCCSNMDLEIKVLPKYDTSNGDDFNEYKCKNCGTTWVKRTGKSGAAHTDSEIEDYHRGLVSELKLRCPVCHSATIHMIIVNHDKRPHEHEIYCSKCGWKQRFPFTYGYMEKEKEKDAEKEGEKTESPAKIE